MSYSTGRKYVPAILGIVAIATLGGSAAANPGEGVASETFVTANLLEDTEINHDRVKVQTKDPTTVRVQRLTFAPGGRTGWHHHPGAVVVAVQSGSVTLTETNCGTTTYGPGLPNGSVFIEGHDDAHEARSTSGATVYVTYLAPDAVFRIEDTPRSCP